MKKQISVLLSKLRYKYGEILIKKLKSKVEKYFPRLSKLYSKIKIILYRGNNFYCPCCGASFRKFYDYGKGELRQSAMCPGCGSLERHRLMLLYLKYRTTIFSKKLKVLHVAPSSILQSIFKSRSNLDYISIDLNSPLAMIKMDITNLRFEDDTFDIILCSHVLEHVIDDNLAMKELYRVLKPTGSALILFPINYNLKKTIEDPKIVLPKERKRYFGKEDHVRVYGLDYVDKIKKSGFIVKDDNFLSVLKEDFKKKLSINAIKKIYCWSK